MYAGLVRLLSPDSVSRLRASLPAVDGVPGVGVDRVVALQVAFERQIGRAACRERV